MIEELVQCPTRMERRRAIHVRVKEQSVSAGVFSQPSSFPDASDSAAHLPPFLVRLVVQEGHLKLISDNSAAADRAMYLTKTTNFPLDAACRGVSQGRAVVDFALPPLAALSCL